MAPLKVEIYGGPERSWVPAGEVKPNDPSGTVSNNLPDGSREVYAFSCAQNDSQSVIKKLPAGIDVATSRYRAIDLSELESAEIVVTLKRGDKPYHLTVKTDVSPQSKMMRFTHV